MADQVREQKSAESLLWEYDVSAQLPDGATLATVSSSSLTDTLDESAYDEGLSGSPSVSGNRVRQRVVGLVPGHTYRLVWVWVDSANNTQASGLVLRCPY